jgi:hypothetical protein
MGTIFMTELLCASLAAIVDADEEWPPWTFVARPIATPSISGKPP